MFLKLWEEFEQQNILRPYKVIIWQSHNVLMISWHTSWGNDYQISKLYLNCYHYFYLFYLYSPPEKWFVQAFFCPIQMCHFCLCPPIPRSKVPPDEITANINLHREWCSEAKTRNLHHLSVSFPPHYLVLVKTGRGLSSKDEHDLLAAAGHCATTHWLTAHSTPGL